jgi:hypothetical protein
MALQPLLEPCSLGPELSTHVYLFKALTGQQGFQGSLGTVG